MELFTVLHKKAQKARATFQFFFKHAMFRYHIDSIGEIWI